MKNKGIKIFLLIALLGVFAGCVREFVNYSVVPMPHYTDGDNDGYQNIFYGIPESDTDTVLNRIGYSLGYSYELKLAVWVSYYSKREWVLSEAITGRHFKPDPDLPSDCRAYNRDYSNSGYDRGHLAMQADMRGRSEQCEREACYFSNVAPQLPNFNRGIWNVLEDKIRDYVVDNGDCWVIDGPVFYDGYSETIGLDNIPVPDAFYKIMVDTTNGGILSYAFIIPNEVSDLPLDSFAVSIDSIEKVTSIDFFPELPDKIENILERRINYLNPPKKS